MMTENGLIQILFYFLVVLALVPLLGEYIARVYQGRSFGLNVVLAPLERLIYRVCGIDPHQTMDWKKYLSAMLYFNLLGTIACYVLLRIQNVLPFNPETFNALPAKLSFNTAISFVTNTDWQAYSGENTLSYASQILSCTVQNFLSAATGMAILMAFIRGFKHREDQGLGNYWVDMVRGILYILLPLALIFAIALSSQGVPQNFKPYQKTTLLQPRISLEQQGGLIQEQIVPMGPIASQVAIKQLGTNGGGFFGTNSAHPFENPTPITNFLEMLAVLLIPAALCYSFGILVYDKKQGIALLATMLIILVPLFSLSLITEQKGNPLLTAMGVLNKPVPHFYTGGNMEGKETRFGIVSSTLWSTLTTATSNGSVNAMLDSFIPFSSFLQLALMHFGEVIFGGVGSGLYGMVLLVIITVFVAGLMVGRAPEYLGKKIEPFEMKMASLAVLLMPMIVLVLTALGVITTAGTAAIGNPGAHGFTEILYAFTSMGNNNGSAFAGLNANTPFYTLFGGLEMLALRFWIAIPALAIAGSLIRKKNVPMTLGTLPTHTPLFIIMLISIVCIIGALTFMPALALGPLVEQLILWGQYGH